MDKFYYEKPSLKRKDEIVLFKDVLIGIYNLFDKLIE